MMVGFVQLSYSYKYNLLHIYNLPMDINQPSTRGLVVESQPYKYGLRERVSISCTHTKPRHIQAFLGPDFKVPVFFAWFLSFSNRSFFPPANISK